MIRDDDGTLLLAATDLTDHLACEHLTEQRRRQAVGERGKPHAWEDAHGDLIRERGEQHEREQFERLKEAAGGDWVDLAAGGGSFPRTAPEFAAARGRTEAAMRAGTRLIFQAGLFDGRWQGRADFLRRIEEPSALGPWSYEVIDTKLSRQVRPATVHQLALYSRLVGEIQGRAPALAHVITGDGTEHAVDLGRYAALHRHQIRRLERVLAMGERDTYPEPTGHCDICRFDRECSGRRREDDHLSLVAGAARTHRERLVAAGIGTLGALAEHDPAAPLAGLAPERVDLLHHQARLQSNARQGLSPVRRHLEPLAERGYARLPAPGPGDLFFDLEGDPYLDTEGGVEFLWGWCDAAGDYECVWALDRAAEREALRAFIDRVESARAAHPDMHVYHYAPHERSALSRLAMTHGVGEAEVDDWLRSGVLVDLYGVVRQGLQVGEESYSLKRLEHHHGFRRLEESVRAGGGAIATFEAWRECGAQELLDAIRDYNREDCESTRSLAAWLWEHMRPEAEAQFGVDFGALMAEVPEAHDPPPWLGEVEALRERLHAGLPDEPADDHLDEAERRLLGHLILYHHRENKPQWWDYFRMAGLSAEELADEREAIGLIALDESVAPTPYKRSLDWTLRFPPQETKLGAGPARDPIAGDNHTIVSVDEGTLVLRRGKGKDAPRPTALMGGTPPDPKALRGALVELAGEVADAAGAAGRFPALRALLRGDPPALDPSLLRPEVDSLVVATLALSGTTLPVQGPPGTGKTYSGARMIVAALAAGRRVAITANSHAAIQNLLRAVEEHAAEVGAPFAGAYRGEGYDGSAGYIEELGNEEIEAGDHQLVAGTAWLLSREAFRAEGPRFDLLFVDEAGQMALAAALAAGTCADSLVLLGDPQQLPQVNQAAHPEGAGASVLEHVLAGHDTLPSDRGVLLDVSWRMHPEVCAFVSERSYGGLLASRPECAVRSVDAPGPLAGAGLRTIEVDHAGRSQESAEEAQAVARACADLLAGGTVTDRDGSRRPLTAEGIMVVAPFNMAVACIRRAVPEGVRVGTVDRFQGQEAPVVFFAMTCSSGEDVPRGLEFLFERNRLNVAISRAQCLAVLVHSPRLLDADCRSLEQMALVDGACRFVEMAAGQAGVITPA